MTLKVKYKGNQITNMLTHASLGDDVKCQGYRTDFEISIDSILNYLVRNKKYMRIIF